MKIDKPKVLVLGVEKPKTEKWGRSDFTSSTTNQGQTITSKTETSQNTPEFVQNQEEQAISTVSNAQEIPETLQSSKQVNLRVKKGDRELDIVYQATSSVKQGNRRMKNIRSKLRSKRT